MYKEEILCCMKKISGCYIYIYIATNIKTQKENLNQKLSLFYKRKHFAPILAAGWIFYFEISNRMWV